MVYRRGANCHFFEHKHALERGSLLREGPGAALGLTVTLCELPPGKAARTSSVPTSRCVECPVLGIVLSSQGHPFWLPFLTQLPGTPLTCAGENTEQQRAGVDRPSALGRSGRGLQKCGPAAGPKARFLLGHGWLWSFSLTLLGNR